MAKPTTIYTILDRTGSMASVRDGLIEAYNAFIKEQRAVPGKTRWTMVQFDDPGGGPAIETVYENVKGKEVPKLGSSQAPFEPRGMTPLYDAVGITLTKVEKTEGQVVVVIITDGFENASREWSAKKVKGLVKKLQKNGWQFIFMGADQDAAFTGAEIGVHSTVAIDNTAQAYYAGTQSVSDMAASYRTTGRAVAHSVDLRGTDSREDEE